ncbi:PREDICTED: ubiquinol oxidase 2, mitochondrial-like [Nicotiana attenuata]|uniref:Ubiquinol oxidase n=1 Tax=Nicotiana attenuata TaxID=49451 RepID=A0A314KNB0_NICAT|nr:PREDICTED: ubiquinol oxidase 2, mitochondrial-like [Nicotiana attenuata]OIT30836.1 ubiquinol oxidase 1, mitochondrial [Nicotiana attenuata]
MMSRSVTRIARSMINHIGPRNFSTLRPVAGNEAGIGVVTAAAGFLHGNSMKGSEKVVAHWVRYFSVMGPRNASTVALSDKEHNDQDDQKINQSGATGRSAAATDSGNNKGVVSYWGIQSPKVTKEDGTPWRWNCFMPWETYKADLSIDLKKHHAPVTLLDKVAYWTVKALRFPTDLFFQRRYGCRAMMLETVAAVPGMVGGMLLHCKSLRKFEHSGGWIKALLEEAENERMHLMTFMEIAKPKWYERALVFAVQGVFFNAYFVTYLLSPKLAHRIVGYLEEEAIHSYTEFLKELDKGNIENVRAPAIAIDYWRLPEDSTLKDVVMVVRADEAHHRDVNHFASDIHYQGQELKDCPAPLGYH